MLLVDIFINFFLGGEETVETSDSLTTGAEVISGSAGC
jgi:hypothetical protein